MIRRLLASLLTLAVLAFVVPPGTPPAAAAQSDVQMRLARQSDFLSRVESRLVVYAKVVKEEGALVANHTARAAYADQVLANSAAKAIQWAVYLSGSTNVAGTLTNGDDGRVYTSVTDAALDSQIATDWNLFAVAG